MNKDKIIKDILLEYSVLSKTGGIDKLDHDLLVTAIENCGYASYFSIPKLVNEIETKKTAIGLSDSDIEIINKIIGRGKPEQARVFFEDDDLRKLDLLNLKNQPTTIFPKDRGQDASLTMSDVVKIGKEEGGLKVLHSNSSLRIATNKGTRVSNINTTSGIKTDTGILFGQLMLFFKLVKEHPDLFTLGVVSKSPGKEKEEIAVTHMNVWFKENNPEKTPMRLHFWDQNERVATGVEVDSAIRLNQGKDAKADIALRNQETDVFWISFKGAEFNPDVKVQSVSRVDFPQYSGMLGLDKSFTDGKVKMAWDGIKVSFIEGIKRHYPVPPLTINPKTTTFDEQNKAITINGKSVLETLGQGTKFYIAVTSDFRNAFYKFVTKPSTGKKYLYYMGGSKFLGHLDFLDGTKATRIIAGKTIYGPEFDIDGKAPFSKNNCCILMHTTTNVEMSVINPEDMTARDPSKMGSVNWIKSNSPNASNERHLLIKTTEGGHVWFNPNMPLPKNAKDPIFAYRPTLYGKSGTTDQAASLTIGNDDYLFLNFSLVTLPLAKVDATSIDLKK